MCVSVSVCVCVKLRKRREHFSNFLAHRSHAQPPFLPGGSLFFGSFDSASITLRSSKCQHLLKAVTPIEERWRHSEVWGEVEILENVPTVNSSSFQISALIAIIWQGQSEPRPVPLKIYNIYKDAAHFWGVAVVSVKYLLLEAE